MDSLTIPWRIIPFCIFCIRPVSCKNFHGPQRRQILENKLMKCSIIATESYRSTFTYWEYLKYSKLWHENIDLQFNFLHVENTYFPTTLAINNKPQQPLYDGCEINSAVSMHIFKNYSQQFFSLIFQKRVIQNKRNIFISIFYKQHLLKTLIKQ